MDGSCFLELPSLPYHLWPSPAHKVHLRACCSPTAIVSYPRRRKIDPWRPRSALSSGCWAPTKNNIPSIMTKGNALGPVVPGIARIYNQSDTDSVFQRRSRAVRDDDGRDGQSRWMTRVDGTAWKCLYCPIILGLFEHTRYLFGHVVAQL